MSSTPSAACWSSSRRCIIRILRSSSAHGMMSACAALRSTANPYRLSGSLDHISQPSIRSHDLLRMIRRSFVRRSLVPSFFAVRHSGHARLRLPGLAMSPLREMWMFSGTVTPYRLPTLTRRIHWRMSMTSHTARQPATMASMTGTPYRRNPSHRPDHCDPSVSCSRPFRYWNVFSIISSPFFRPH